MLRDCVSLMAVGLELPRSDTVAEDVRAASNAQAAAKELGDVRRAHEPCAFLLSCRLTPDALHEGHLSLLSADLTGVQSVTGVASEQ